MKASIVPIGNSKGIRIPKVLLQECHIGKEVDLEVKRESIVIKPVRSEPRKGWERAFKKMHGREDDRLLIDDSIGLDMKGWEW